MTTRRVMLAAMAAPCVFRSGRASAARRPRVGLSLPLTGVQATVAEELLAGYQLAFSVGKQQGIDVDLVVEDDGSKSDRTASTVRKFGLDGSFLAVSGIVGTPHAKAAIPEARSAGLPVIGIRSGAGELRDGGAWVYHLRASYEAELDKMAGMLRGSSPRVSVVFSKDAFGEAAMAHLQRIAAPKGLQIVASVPAERNGADIASAVGEACSPKHRPQGLLVLMITRPTVDALKAARAGGFLGPTFAMSFTAGAELVSAGSELVRGLGLVSAFPLPRASVDPTSLAFRAGLAAVGRDGLLGSVTAFEGFSYGMAVVGALARCGHDASREQLVRCLVAAPGVVVAGEQLAFDGKRVGRRYLEVMYFDRHGLLRK